ncbi:MAG: tRNA glutamyl-Q(34) synthetase GluQRS [Roseinatronobacter sp.]
MRPEGRITRFAPSPTGPLHLGHAYAALIAAERGSGGRFLLRIEDIDLSRCRADWEQQIYEDLAWLGLTWARPVLRQSERIDAYRAALDRLQASRLVYPCRCRRADIRAAMGAPQENAVPGPDGLRYPGTCRGRTMADAGPDDALRLDMAAALEQVERAQFVENGPIRTGVHQLDRDWLRNVVGDVVLARREMGTSYHLSVVIDDAAQGITEVTRGLDLFDATAIHVILQQVLKLPTPRYYHHDLIRDGHGRRLAKRDDARALALYRAEGVTPVQIRQMVGLAAVP